MKVVYLLFMALTWTLSANAALVGLSTGSTMPNNMIAAIVKESEMPADSFHSIADGVLNWSGGTIAAVVIEDPNGICAIYRYQGGQLDLPFDGVPCKFQGPPSLMSDRKTAMPDVVFAVELFVPNRGGMANHKVAFYYDSEKNAYCESQSLASWYLSGNRALAPDLQDGQCLAGSE
ncbi:hypothetical protein C1893_04095 [Pseudomonas sp. MPR-ANC1]|uniref:hypothetical protein n=1 Tax=Pseudomonas sp. MPR-ANC1 TaxID=2075548 RepID=UPI000CD09D36|nr:hypothetical protein [Pseudomonas sp. MPR-ANC1]POA49663.1 hypothetical protein C1893_04095 [Pseudomonas sp. MPR-ANC1]